MPQNSILISAYRGDTKLVERRITADPTGREAVTTTADRVIDEIITELHAGKYGDAGATIYADFFDESLRLWRGFHARHVVPAPMGTRTETVVDK